ncbi:hypothetical protein C8R46DRAFT_1354140 [Mycena filopes]|nr:hypothetical protein C8R46DRAFT_1354140 [Mycena filopes]
MSRKAKGKSKSKANSSTTLTSTPQEECLRNSDLVDQILRHLLGDLGAAAAGGCPVFSHSAVRLIWRRLGNIVPLLRLLPAFKVTDSQYVLSGVVSDAEWDVFDRHAALCREVVYEEPRRTVNSLVYVRLAMRKSIPLLPNISLFDWSSVAPDGDFLFYVSPSLVSLTLNGNNVPGTEIFLSILSAQSPPLAHLILSAQPTTMLALCGGFRVLRSLSLTRVNDTITMGDFLAIASMPSLETFTTDLIGWTELNLESIAPGTLFPALTDLTILASRGPLQLTMPDLLTRIGAPSIVSIRVGVAHAYDRWATPGGSGEAFAALARCISATWSASLKTLDVQKLACTHDEFSALQGLTSIETLTLNQTVQGSLGDARVLALVRTWANLASLTITPGGAAEADLEFIKCVAQHCPLLRVLQVPFFPGPLPDDVSTTPLLVHPLSAITFFPMEERDYGRWNTVDVHVAARHIDRLFPRVASITGSGYQSRWKEIQTLVLLFQDVRRTAWEQK